MKRNYYTPVRRNHIVGPAGVGSLLVTRSGVTVLLCGLSTWMEHVPAFGLDESAKRIDRDRRVRAHELHDRNMEADLGISRLLMPPIVDDDASYGSTWFVPAVRFPRAEYCHNPACRLVEYASAENPSIGRCMECGGKFGSRRQQVPTVLICPSGHLDEVDWSELAHGSRPCTADKTRLTYRVINNILAPEVRCICGAGARFDPNQNRPCTGARPWLPGAESEKCSESMRVLERTSTVVYFPDVRSALHIPADGELRDTLLRWLEDDNAAAALRNVPGKESLDTLLKLVNPLFPNITPESLFKHVQHLKSPTPEREGRIAELEALTAGKRGTHTGDGPPILDAELIPANHFAASHIGANTAIKTVVAVHRLAETRALAGFTRVEPPSRISKGTPGYHLMWGHHPNDLPGHDWLPGMRVYGEGILLELNAEFVSAWTSQVGTSIRSIMVQGAELTPEFQLAHTFAHLLMNAASLQCGYPVASLRDRIYATPGRTALLIYTGEGDVIGTLGGLVELAQPGELERLLDRTYANAKWCALDPVCMNPILHIKNDMAGACHQCCLLPETSCEWWNRGLDRATLVGRDSLSGFLSMANAI